MCDLDLLALIEGRKTWTSEGSTGNKTCWNEIGCPRQHAVDDYKMSAIMDHIFLPVDPYGI